MSCCVVGVKLLIVMVVLLLAWSQVREEGGVRRGRCEEGRCEEGRCEVVC
jgi:hypothetical protein